MIQEEIKVRVLIPNKGHMLTQAFEVEITNRVVSEKVYLAVTDEPSNWKEITQAEADAIIAEQERLANEEMNKQNG